MIIDKFNWRQVKLGDITIKKEENDKANIGIRFNKFLKVEHLDPECLHIKRWGNVGVDELPPTFYKIFRKGQVLYPTRNPHLKRVALASFDGICGEKTLTLEPIHDLIEDKFYPFIFLSQSFYNHSTGSIIGSTNPHVRWRDVAEYKFLLPPKEQQAKLAELLWAADNCIENYQSLLQSIIITQKIFAIHNYQDRTRPKANLSSIADVNPSIPSNLNDNEQEVSFLTMADVSEEGAIINHQKRRLKEVRKGFTYFGEGDTLFAKITPCMENGKGTIALNLFNGIGFGSTEFHVLRPKIKSDQMFCFFITKMDLFRREAEKRMVGSAGQKRVPSSFLSEFSFHIPDVDKRMLFGEKMLMFEERKNILRVVIEQSRLLKQNIINQIFT